MAAKLRLDVDTLRVELFNTLAVYGTGTVGAHATGALEDTCWGGCVQYSGDPDTCGGGGEPTFATCAGMGTCPKSGCGGMPTCGPTMWHTCLSCAASDCGGVTPCSPCTG
jgi:hypothetical protein